MDPDELAKLKEKLLLERTSAAVDSAISVKNMCSASSARWCAIMKISGKHLSGENDLMRAYTKMVLLHVSLADYKSKCACCGQLKLKGP